MVFVEYQYKGGFLADESEQKTAYWKFHTQICICGTFHFVPAGLVGADDSGAEWKLSLGRDGHTDPVCDRDSADEQQAQQRSF